MFVIIQYLIIVSNYSVSACFGGIGGIRIFLYANWKMRITK